MCKLKSQEWTVAGTYTFSTPTGVTAGWLTMLGGGAGGFGSGIIDGLGRYFPGAGGGSAQGCFSLLVPLSGDITVTVGAGGAGNVANDQTLNTGTASSFGSYTVCPGGTEYIDLAGAYGSVIVGRAGGPRGLNRTSALYGIDAASDTPQKDSTLFAGGSAGGRANDLPEGVDTHDGYGAGGQLGGPGGPEPLSYIVGGSGGGSTVRGRGGEGGDPEDVNALNGYAATAAGAGGGGGSIDSVFDGDPPHVFDTNGGAGAAGYVAIMWAA